MRTQYVLCTAALLLMMGCAQAALAMGGEYGKGDPKHPIGNSTWPTGLDVMANRADRIGGYWINSLDTFLYAGDAKAFNNFLQQYARVEGSHTLYIYTDHTYDHFTLQPRSGQKDWELNAGYGMATVNLSLNGRINLRDLRIPRNIRIEFVGKKTIETAAFLARRQASPIAVTQRLLGQGGVLRRCVHR